MATSDNATPTSTPTSTTDDISPAPKPVNNPTISTSELHPADWTLVHFLTKRVAKDTTTFGDGFGTWYRQVQSTEDGAIMRQFAFGGVRQGPQYYISCRGGRSNSNNSNNSKTSSREASTTATATTGCTSERTIRRLFIRWHKHCRTSGCACDLNRLSGRNTTINTSGTQQPKLPYFQFYDAATHEPVRFKTPADAVCTRGCLRVEARSHWHARRCGAGCARAGAAARDEYVRSKVVAMPLCYVPESSRERLETLYPRDKKVRGGRAGWAAAACGAPLVGSGAATPRRGSGSGPALGGGARGGVRLRGSNGGVETSTLMPDGVGEPTEHSVENRRC